MSEQLDKDLKDDHKENVGDLIGNGVEPVTELVIYEYRDDGVYLTVFAPKGEVPHISLQEVVEEIGARKIFSPNINLIHRTVREMSGQPVLIAPPQHEALKDGWAVLKISPNKMEAYITVYPPLGNGKPLTRQALEVVLREGNVVFGINNEIIDLAVSKQRVNFQLVAKGINPVNGQRATIEYKCQSSTILGKPTEMDNGKIDYYELDLIHNVEPGEVLAVKIAATQGIQGSTVTGEIIPPKPGKDVQLVAGKNVELLENGFVARSTERGHAIIAGNKISVSTVYEINGDVDFNTGNIDFNGSVIVKGAVTEGFRVVADGNVDVLNIIAGGVVECTGNIKVKNGIVGRNKSIVKAGGNVVTRFVENSIVESGGDVLIGEAIMHSKVSAKLSVVVGGKGVIVGGTVRAGEEISCKIVGSSLATATELEAGVNPELRNEYNRLTKEKQVKESDYIKAEQATKLLKQLLDAKGELPPEQMAVFTRVSRTVEQLGLELEEIKIAIENVEASILQSERGRLLVQGIVHPGVKITIGTAVMHIRDDYSYVSFTKDGSDIQISPYK